MTKWVETKRSLLSESIDLPMGEVTSEEELSFRAPVGTAGVSQPNGGQGSLAGSPRLYLGNLELQLP